MTNYPDVWIVVEITYPDEKYHRVLAGWYGGYTFGDSWKLSSSIERIVDCGDSWEIHNASGSIYVCHKQCERMSSYTRSIYDSYQTKAGGGEFTFEQVDIIKLLQEYSVS